MRRQYRYCAKCLTEAALAPGNYVCGTCHGTPGWFNGCAACGIRWSQPNIRAWVCLTDLAHR
jgi:hypothetical protein